MSSLLDVARAVPLGRYKARKNRPQGTTEANELLIEFLRGSLTIAQMAAALGIQPGHSNTNSSVKYWAIGAIRAGIANGSLRLEQVIK